MPDLPSNLPGSQPDGPEFPDPLGGGESGDFLGLGSNDAPAAPLPEAEATESFAQATETSLEPAPSEEVPDWALEEDDGDTMSWLMELEGEDGQENTPFETGIYDGGEDLDEVEVASAPPSGSGWLLRAAIAGVSLGLGFTGARFFSSQQSGGAGQGTNVARVETPGNTGATQNVPPTGTTTNTTAEPAVPVQTTEARPPRELVELGPLPPANELEGPWRLDPTTTPPLVIEGPTAGELATETPAPIEGVGTPPGLSPEGSGPQVATTTETEGASTAGVQPTSERVGSERIASRRFTGESRNPYMSVPPPFLTLGGSSASQGSDTGGGPSVMVTQGTGTPNLGSDDNGTTRVVRAPGAPGLSQEDLGGKLREASAADLSGLWVGGAIPMERITAATKLMTPGVGRVRVLLTSGEVFEGDLYAVGESKVWIQSELGKMALLGWQVDRIEHLLDETNSSTSGTPTTHLAGMDSVRVRTPGGVFYGSLVDQTEESVTLLTAEGARITLHDAEVDTAGMSATHLVDASGAIPDEEPEEE